MKSLSVFCGSSAGQNEVYHTTAAELGNTLAQQNIKLVYGAGNVGLMGIVADATLKAGGEVLGVIPEFLKAWEVYHTGLTELIVTETMHERKQIMADQSDGVIVLPGGWGTLDEFFEILTWKQLHLHQKPIGLFNVNGYYDHILAHFQLMVQEGFLKEVNINLVVVSDTIDGLLEKMKEAPIAKEGKWVRN